MGGALRNPLWVTPPAHDRGVLPSFAWEVAKVKNDGEIEYWRARLRIVLMIRAVALSDIPMKDVIRAIRRAAEAAGALQ